MKYRNFAENQTIDDKYSRRLIKGKVSATMGINSPTALVSVYGKNANRIELLRMLERESKFKLIWYVLFVSFAITFVCFVPSSWLACLDLLILLVNIDLVSRGKVSGVYIGIVECLLYAFITLQAGLYGDVFKMIGICIPINIYTIVSWTKNARKLKAQSSKYADSNEADIEIKKLNAKGWVLTLAFSVVLTGLSYLLLKFVLGQKVSLLLNSITLGIMIVYKVLAGARYMESWLFGIVQTIITLCMWVSLIATGGATIENIPMMAISLSVISNDIYAYNLWKALYRKIAINGSILLNKRPLSIRRVVALKRRFKNMKWNKDVEAKHLQENSNLIYKN